MNCMKCGREVAGNQAFCDECLAEMQKYPVKPGTVVLLPSRRENHHGLKKSPKRRTFSPEEQIRILKLRVRVFGIALLVCIAMILALAYPALRYWRADNHKIGQNYSVVTPTTPGTTKTAD